MLTRTRISAFSPGRGAVITGGASGIGLATVKRIVERLSGSISVESEEGVGSRFVVDIPHTAAQAA